MNPHSSSSMPIPRALTFDDILLVPAYSDVTPNLVSTEVQFSASIQLKVPILSAAMDTVTESKVAQVMAQLGGMGVIHKNLSIDDQALEVEKVKKYESGMITDPITLEPEASVRQALGLMKKYSISGVPVTHNEKLVGILTNRDLRFEQVLDQPIKNLMTSKNLITTKVGTTLEQAKALLKKHRIEKLLVVDNENQLRGLITIKDIEKAENFPQATKDKRGRLVVGAALGVDRFALERAAALVKAHVDVLVLDSAHGHSKNVIDLLKTLREKFPNVTLVAGNVVTKEGADDLISAGADVVKVGVGPGSICTTRMIAGVGMPQISAIRDCSEVAKSRGKTVIADGGIKYSGDITKALALGAHAVMVGNLIAGAEEAPGETILYQGRTYKLYRGMGSMGAMAKGSKDRYGQAGIDDSKLVPEGIEGKVPYKGKVSEIIHQLCGGLRAGMGYLGAATISDLQAKARFVEISSSGLRESHVHDVSILREAPNYRVE